VLLPTILIQRSGSGGGYAGPFSRRDAGESTMHPSDIVVMLELVQLAHQIRSIPEEHAVQVLAPDRADQALDERMRNRRLPDCLDLLDLEDPQVGEPAVETEKGVVIS
jgi:hypothetical protein